MLWFWGPYNVYWFEHQCHKSNCACISRTVFHQHLSIRSIHMRMVHSVLDPFFWDRPWLPIIARWKSNKKNSKRTIHLNSAFLFLFFLSNVIKAESKIWLSLLCFTFRNQEEIKQDKETSSNRMFSKEKINSPIRKQDNCY